MAGCLAGRERFFRDWPWVDGVDGCPRVEEEKEECRWCVGLCCFDYLCAVITRNIGSREFGDHVTCSNAAAGKREIENATTFVSFLFFPFFPLSFYNTEKKKNSLMQDPYYLISKNTYMCSVVYLLSPAVGLLIFLCLLLLGSYYSWRWDYRLLY